MNVSEVASGILFTQSNITAAIFPPKTGTISAAISTTPLPFSTAETGGLLGGLTSTAPLVATGVAMTTSTLVEALGPTTPSGVRTQQLPLSSAMLSRIPTILLGLYVVNSVLASHRTSSRLHHPSLPQLPGLTPKQQQRGHLVRVSANEGPNMAHILAPRRFQRKKRRLLKKLGENFEPFWMSIDQPEDFLKVKVSDEKDPDIENDWIRSIHPLDLMKSLRDLNITSYSSQDLLEGASNQHTSSRRQADSTVRMVMSVLQDWLVKKATCPVRYIWEDMGVFFWPRYIRRGYCALDNIPERVKLRVQSSLSDSPIIQQDCSWPPGMFCSPGEEKRLKIFTWKCQSSGLARKRTSRSSDPVLSPEPNLGSDEAEFRDTKIPAVGGTKGSFQRTLESVGSHRRSAAQQGRKNLKMKTAEVSVDGDKLNTILLRNNNASRQKRSNIISEEIVGYIGSHNLPQRDAAASDNVTELEPREDYSHMTWKELRKKFKVRCRWQKITFPVVQHCQCSC